MNGCRQYLKFLEVSPPLEGCVSLEHGFLPPNPASDRLPASHSAWDDAAAQLPESFFSNRAQAILGRLPLLGADEEHLPDAYLTRASIILSSLAHAYWRFGAEHFYAPRITQVPGTLPACILKPWQSVSRRLGRHDPEHPFQSFYDLFLANWRRKPNVTAEAPPLVENLDILVPSFGNDAERVFYAAFVEMHHHFTPVVGAICRLETSIADDDMPEVTTQLQVIAGAFESATTVWRKISARPESNTFCDPITWSKTVAILGVPPARCPQGGTSGACAPIVYVTDALLARSNYDTYYGKYLQDEASPMVARAVHEFARRARALGLVQYVDTRRDSLIGDALAEALDAVVEAYSGRAGWLGRHASKAFSYLCISTITGRNASVSGHERYFNRQTWDQTARNLNAARLERASGCPHTRTTPQLNAPASGKLQATARCPLGTARTQVANDRETRSGHASLNRAHVRNTARVYTRAEVARHHHAQDLWVIIDETVYDLGEYSKKHPGGNFILRAYAGQDVSEVFWSQNVHVPAVLDRILPKLAIGCVAHEPRRRECAIAYDLLFTLLRTKNALNLQFLQEFPHQPGMKLYSDEQAHMQLWYDKLPAAYAHLDSCWQALAESPTAKIALEEVQWVSRNYDLRRPSCHELAFVLCRRCQMLQQRDEDLVEQLLDLTFDCIERIRAGLASPAALRTLREHFVHEISACFQNLNDDLAALKLESSVLSGPPPANQNAAA